MIEVVAKIERADSRHIWLLRNNSADCQRCQQGRGCGGAIWGKLLTANSLLKLPNPLRAKAGSRLRLTIAESRFMWMAAVAYLLPILWLLVATGLGHLWYGEAGAISGGVVALIAWLMVARTVLVPWLAMGVFQDVKQTLIK